MPGREPRSGVQGVSNVDGGSRGERIVIRTSEEAERREVLRRDFIANVTHELKTPAGALALLAEVMSNEDDPDVLHRLAERIMSEAERLNMMIEDLLDFSRTTLEEGTGRTVVPVHDIIDKAIERVTAAAHAHDVALLVGRITPGLSVRGSGKQLASALGNLLENAVKYSPEHGTVSLAVITVGSRIEFRVTDRGIGIAPADVPRIFDRFFRSDAARVRDAAGAGLGLAIVHQVAADHAGEVLVSSREGRGSTFILRLPLAVPAVVATIETI